MSAHPSHALRISVVVLTYNGLEDTRACVQSLLNAVHRPDELIIYDNGSRTNEAEALKQEFGEALTLVYHSDQNKGVVRGYNEALQLATGDIVAIFNNDTVADPHWLEPIRSAFADEKVGGCFPKIRSLFHKERFDYAGAAGGFVDILGYPFARGRIFHTIEEDHLQYNSVVAADWTGACLVMRKKTIEQIGNFDPAFYAYMDEIDLFWRMRSAGWKTITAPASIIFHKGAASWGGLKYKRTVLLHRNNLILITRNMPYAWLMFILPTRLLCDVLTSLYYLCRGEWYAAVAVWHAFFSFLIHVPSSLFMRHPRSLPRFRKSILWAYFVQRKRTYAALIA